MRALKSPEVAILTSLGALTLLSLALLGNAGWPGAPSRCLHELLCYCEAVHDGPLRQPVNTLSNLVPLAAGVAVAVEAALLRYREGHGDRARLARLFALTLWFQGAGSMFFHGSLTEWGAVVDAVSMFSTLGVLWASALLRAGAVRSAALPAVWGFAVAIGLSYRLWISLETAPAVAAIVLPALAFEALLVKRGRVATPRWFVAAAAIFGTSTGVWALSATPAQPLCEPHSLLQGHALWHALAAAAVTCLWWHARVNLRALRERRGGGPRGWGLNGAGPRALPAGSSA